MINSIWIQSFLDKTIEIRVGIVLFQFVFHIQSHFRNDLRSFKVLNGFSEPVSFVLTSDLYPR